MTALEIIVVSVGGAMALALTHYVAFLVGNLYELKRTLRRSERDLSWAKVLESQASFNLDFFDELFANRDSRLR